MNFKEIQEYQDNLTAMETLLDEAIASSDEVEELGSVLEQLLGALSGMHNEMLRNSALDDNDFPTKYWAEELEKILSDY